MNTDSPLAGRVICNPMDLAYCYSDQVVQGYPRLVWREGADPSVVRYRGRYFLFVSMSGGFWHSPDLASWEFVATPGLPVQDYAPDVREIDGALVVTASKHDGPCSFWRATDPLAGEWEELPGTFSFWDPNLFQDDDGRVYLYWGCSPDSPIYGVELDRTTFHPLADPVELFGGDRMAHGWEWKGDADGITTPEALTDESGKDPRPFVEGAWMTKHLGRYHLQYAAPGTELNTYADGVYTSTGPLGPFTYSPDNPYSSVPGGFAPGAGHGSTVQDEYGNWWHLATIRISVNHVFERRIGIYPAGFDADGVLVCNQSFADHPIVVPLRTVDPWTEVSTGWRLLSRARPVTATSSLDGHGPELVVDEDIRSAWVSAGSGAQEGVTVDLGPGCHVSAIQVNLADHDVASFKPAPLVDPHAFSTRVLTPIARPVAYLVELSDDGVDWRTAVEMSDVDAPHRLVVLDEPMMVRFVRVLGGPGAWGAPFALSGIRAFGRRAGDPPETPPVSAVRFDDRTARVSWTSTPDTEGVDVRYGRAPDRLVHSWLVYGRDDLVIPMLSAGLDYWVAVDAFNGSGVTRGVPVPIDRAG